MEFNFSRPPIPQEVTVRLMTPSYSTIQAATNAVKAGDEKTVKEIVSNLLISQKILAKRLEEEEEKGREALAEMSKQMKELIAKESDKRRPRSHSPSPRTGGGRHNNNDHYAHHSSGESSRNLSPSQAFSHGEEKNAAEMTPEEYMDSLKRNLEEREIELAEREAEVDALHERLEQNIAELQERRREMESEKTAVAEWQESVRNAATTERELRACLQETEKEKESLEEKLSEMQEQIHLLENALAETSAKLMSAVDGRGDEEISPQKKSNNNNGNKATNNDANNTSNNGGNIYDESRQRIAELEEQVETLRMSLDAMAAMRTVDNDSDNHHERLKEENERLRQEIASLSAAAKASNGNNLSSKNPPPPPKSSPQRWRKGWAVEKEDGDESENSPTPPPQKTKGVKPPSWGRKEEKKRGGNWRTAEDSLMDKDDDEDSNNNSSEVNTSGDSGDGWKRKPKKQQQEEKGSNEQQEDEEEEVVVTTAVEGDDWTSEEDKPRRKVLDEETAGKITLLQEKNTELACLVEILEEDIAQLKSKFENEKRALEKTRDDELELQRTELTSELNDSVLAISHQLEAQVEQLKREKAELEEELNSIQESLTQENEEQALLIRDQSSVIETQRERIETLERELEWARNKEKELVQRFDSLSAIPLAPPSHASSSVIEGEENDKDMTAAAIDKFDVKEKQLERAKEWERQANAFEQAWLASEESIKEAKLELAATVEAQEALQEVLLEKERQIEVLKEDNDAIAMEKERLVERIEELQSEIEEMKDTIAEFANIKEMEKRQAELENEADQWRNKATQLEAKSVAAEGARIKKIREAKWELMLAREESRRIETDLKRAYKMASNEKNTNQSGVNSELAKFRRDRNGSDEEVLDSDEDDNHNGNDDDDRDSHIHMGDDHSISSSVVGGKKSSNNNVSNNNSSNSFNHHQSVIPHGEVLAMFSPLSQKSGRTPSSSSKAAVKAATRTMQHSGWKI